MNFFLKNKGIRERQKNPPSKFAVEITHSIPTLNFLRDVKKNFCTLRFFGLVFAFNSAKVFVLAFCISFSVLDGFSLQFFGLSFIIRWVFFVPCLMFSFGQHWIISLKKSLLHSKEILDQFSKLVLLNAKGSFCQIFKFLNNSEII